MSCLAVLTMPDSRLFQMVLNRFASFYMLIRPGCHHLVLQRDILLSPAVQIFQYTFGMVAVLVAVRWLDGYRL